jgi:glycine cleavage system H lipoate-binding protein
MRCPFLGETRVRSCGISTYRKPLPLDSIHESEQICSSEGYVDCPAAQGRLEGREHLAQCPFLTEAQVQFCQAAPTTRFIPFSEDLRARCNGAGFRYCESYLQRARPDRRIGPDQRAGEVPVPADRAYATNHMWIDSGDDGVCYVGVDGFLARLLGPAGRVSFAAPPGNPKPSAVVTVGDTDLAMTFPDPLELIGTNPLLRARPETLTADPYGSGWLFEGRATSRNQPGGNDSGSDGLLRGEEAVEWMRSEVDRMTSVVHDLLARRKHSEPELMGDGGVFAAGLARYLDRDELLLIFSRFFTAA